MWGLHRDGCRGALAAPKEMELGSGPTGSARIPLQGHVRTCRGARGRAVRGGRSQGSALEGSLPSGAALRSGLGQGRAARGHSRGWF